MNEIAEKLHHKLLNLRNLHRLVSTEEFSERYARLDHSDQEKLLIAVLAENITEVEKLLKKAIILTELTILELRSMAYQMGIKHANRKSKHVLIDQIEHRRSQAKVPENGNQP